MTPDPKEHTLKDSDLQLVYGELRHMSGAIDDIKNVLKGFDDKYVNQREFDLIIKNLKQRYDGVRTVVIRGIGLVLSLITIGIIGLLWKT